MEDGQWIWLSPRSWAPSCPRSVWRPRDVVGLDLAEVFRRRFGRPVAHVAPTGPRLKGWKRRPNGGFGSRVYHAAIRSTSRTRAASPPATIGVALDITNGSIERSDPGPAPCFGRARWRQASRARDQQPLTYLMATSGSWSERLPISFPKTPSPPPVAPAQRAGHRRLYERRRGPIRVRQIVRDRKSWRAVTMSGSVHRRAPGKRSSIGMVESIRAKAELVRSLAIFPMVEASESRPGAGLPEPAGQRRPGHQGREQRRQPDPHRHRHRRRWPGGRDGVGHGRRHSPRCHGTDLRSVLHDQAGGGRYRAGALHLPRHRQGAGRGDRGRERVPGRGTTVPGGAAPARTSPIPVGLRTDRDNQPT